MDTIDGVHVTKLIFETIGKLLGISGLDCYTKYLEHSFNANINLKVFSHSLQWDSKHALYFYNKQKNQKCSFFCHKNYKNWITVSKHVLPPDLAISFYIDERDNVTKIYDESTVDKLFKEDKGRYILVLKNKTLSLLKAEDKPNLCHFSEKRFIRNTKQKWRTYQHYKDRNLYKLINILVKGKHDSNSNDIDFYDVMYNGDAFKNVKCPIILCTHVHSKYVKQLYKKTRNNRISPNSFKFYTIMTYNETCETTPIVICLTYVDDEFYGYRPKKRYLEYILTKNAASMQNIQGVTDFYKGFARLPECKPLKKKQANNTDDNKLTFEKWWPNYPCRCDCCMLSKTYKDNFEFFKPQTRRSIKLNTVDYMKMFNLYTPQNITKLKEVFDLSTAGLDLESFTLQRNEYDVNFKPISKYSNETKVIAEQEIGMIGYGDDTLDDRDLPVFRSKYTNNPEIAVKAFFDHLFIRYHYLRIKKEKLLTDLILFTNKVYDLHCVFWKKRLINENLKDVKQLIEKSFEHSLPGKFRTHLKKITKNLFVHTFNGGNYDYVLCHKFFITVLKKYPQYINRQPCRIIKNGSKILSIKVAKCEIYFVDILDMLGPGCSLAQFAELTQQEDAKLVFPFKCLTCLKSLNAKTLPEDKRLWFNDLKQEFYSDTEIQKAKDNYARLGCKNVGEYLEIYLRMDVKLTTVGVRKLLGNYFEKFETHPLDVNKNTIASFGSYLFQHNLMDNKKVGIFSPNCLPLYSCIKSSSTGGLTVALRHSADSSNVNESPINNHLSETFTNPVKGVAVFDVASLYPASALLPLPYGPGYMSTSVMQKNDMSMFGVDECKEVMNVLKNDSLTIDNW